MTAAGTWKLVIEQLEPRSGLASGDEVELSESEAIELIASGFAWPAERPSEPAYTLLEDLQAKVGNIELLGPCIENERQIKAVLEEVVGRLLNHTPISITGQRYVKPSLDSLRPQMETVCEELLNRTKP